MATKKQLLLLPNQLVIERNARFLDAKKSNDISAYDQETVKRILQSYVANVESGQMTVNYTDIVVEKNDDGTYTVQDGCTRAIVFMHHYNQLYDIHKQEVYLSATVRSMSKTEQVIANAARSNWPFYVLAKYIAEDESLAKKIVEPGKVQDYKLIARHIAVLEEMFALSDYAAALYLSKQGFSSFEQAFLLNKWKSMDKPRLTLQLAKNLLDRIYITSFYVKTTFIPDIEKMLQESEHYNDAILTKLGQPDLEDYVLVRIMANCGGVLYRAGEAIIAQLELPQYQSYKHTIVECGTPFSFNAVRAELQDAGEKLHRLCFHFVCVVNRKDEEAEALREKQNNLEKALQVDRWEFKCSLQQTLGQMFLDAVASNNQQAPIFDILQRLADYNKQSLHKLLVDAFQSGLYISYNLINFDEESFQETRNIFTSEVVDQAMQAAIDKKTNDERLQKRQQRLLEMHNKHHQKDAKRLRYVHYEVDESHSIYQEDKALTVEEKKVLRKKLGLSPTASEMSIRATFKYLRAQPFVDEALEAAKAEKEFIQSHMDNVWNEILSDAGQEPSESKRQDFAEALDVVRTYMKQLTNDQVEFTPPTKRSVKALLDTAKSFLQSIYQQQQYV